MPRMRILHNELLDATEYRGDVVLCYFSGDDAAAKPLIEELRASEFRFVEDRIDDDEALTHAATQAGDRLLDRAGVMIPFLGDDATSPENRPKYNLLFHRVGYFCTQGPDNLIPCSHSKKGVGLFVETPLQYASAREYVVKDGVSTVLATLRAPGEGRDFSRTKKDVFSLDPQKSGGACSVCEERISYRRVSVELAMHRADFRRALRLYSRRRGAGESVSREGFLSDLEKALVAKVHLFSFGSEENRQPQFTPYDGERAILPCDYPFHYKNHLELSAADADEAKRGIVAVLRIEYLLPVHAPLGLCCKPYIEGNRVLDAKILGRLFHRCFRHGNDVKKTGNRLYFRFNFKNARPSIDAHAEAGRYADIVYPQ